MSQKLRTRGEKGSHLRGTISRMNVTRRELAVAICSPVESLMNDRDSWYRTVMKETDEAGRLG